MIFKGRRFNPKLWVLTALSVLFVGVAVPQVATAYQDPFNIPNRAPCNLPDGGFLFFPTWYKYLDGEYLAKNTSGKPDIQAANVCRPHIDGPGDIWKIVAAVFEIILQLAGIMAVAYIIYGGFRFTMSRGQPGEIAAGRTTIINALIGLVLTVISARLIGYIAGRFSGNIEATFLLPQVSPDNAIGIILSIVIQLAAVFAIMFIVWGGITYARSNGDPNVIKEGKETILYAVVGLIVAIMAQAMVAFLFRRID